MGRQQSPHLLQLGRTNLPPLNDQTVFHAPTLHTPPRRVQPKMKLFFTRLQAPATLTLPASQTKIPEQLQNFFKYLREEYALDGLVEYAAVPDDPTREVPNPAWAAA